MRFRILGSLEAEAGGRLLPSAAPGEQRVLAVLLLNINQAVPVTRLVDALWDGEPPSVRDGQRFAGPLALPRSVNAMPRPGRW